MSKSKTEIMLDMLEYERKHCKNAIIGKAQWLIGDLQDAIRRLEQEDGKVNELGIVQGQGAQIDIACAEYERTKRHIEMVRAALDVEQV